MNRQERELVDALFERLAGLERTPRDPEAESAIREGLRQAPNAVYALVQTVLVQEQALKAANARIEDLEGFPAHEPREPPGFLDSMRETLFGREEPRGSVPPVRPGARPMGAPESFGREPPQPGYPAQESGGRGGSFLGTAAAAAAGVIGGALLMNGIRSVLGGEQSGPFQGAFDQLAGSGKSESPWGGGGNELARDAGVGDIGGSRSAGLSDSGRDQPAGLFGGGDDGDFDDLDADFDIGEA